MTDKTKRFLQKLKDKGHWNDDYDYSKVEYVNAHTKVIVIDKKYDTEHLMIPATLMIGSKCNMHNVVDANDYLIKQFREVHGATYDYSKVEYVHGKTKVTIICPKHGHGEFEQLPPNHKNCHGCPKCVGQGLTTEEVIKQFREVHGDKYDYSKVNYTGDKTKVTIICEEHGHGEFEQIPNSHKRGYGCPKCGSYAKLTTEYVIEQFREVHGDKYDYSKVNYTGDKTNVTIICPKHGEFEQSPSSHKQVQGCPKCHGNAKLTTEDVIKQFREVHGDKYDYSKVNYTGSNNKVVIICPKHGEFEQLPNGHKQGRGCPKCKESKGEREIRNLLIDKDIDFNQEHTFDDCKNILPLRFDFYLPEHSVCIEYQGIQHYEPVDFFGGVSGFENRQYRDKIKEVYCIDNNIQLLKIRYDEDVSNFLNEYFNSKCTINLEY